MKHLPPVPLTEEDFWIWQRFHARGWKARHLVTRMLEQDRRDADLMLKYTLNRMVHSLMRACLQELDAGF